MAKPSSDKVYLDKRVINRAASKGLKAASAQAMDTAGSVVVAQQNWIVRKHRTGEIERLVAFKVASSTHVTKKLAKLKRLKKPSTAQGPQSNQNSIKLARR